MAAFRFGEAQLMVSRLHRDYSAILPRHLAHPSFLSPLVISKEK